MYHRPILSLLMTLLMLYETEALISPSNATEYLVKYGYICAANVSKVQHMMQSDENSAYKVGLRSFQANYASYGLEGTGRMDEATSALMQTSRCGVKDVTNVNDLPLRRIKRFTTTGSTWNITSLKYRIINYTPDLAQETVDSEIELAFKVWSDVTPLTFTKVLTGDAEILISFRSGDHGDGYAFDVAGGELAHAFSPGAGIGGDAHFDESEQWTTASVNGTNLLYVAAHEFGHALGLDHSHLKCAVMAPFFPRYSPDLSLHYDDVKGIQSLYSKQREAAPNFCTIKSIDAVTTHSEGGTTYSYAFKGGYYVRFGDNITYSSSPQIISDDWSGVAGYVDAALYLIIDKTPYTLLFVGSNFHVFEENRKAFFTEGISTLGLSSVSCVDAAFVWKPKEKVYITQGSKYYRFSIDVYKVLSRDKGYPKPLTEWDLSVTSIDAAFQWFTNERTYFFKGDNYYKYDDANDKMYAGYPSPIGDEWFGC